MDSSKVSHKASGNHIQLLINFFTSYRLSTALTAHLSRDWRIQLQIFSGFHLLTPLALNFVCESPRWLISTGKRSRIGEAKCILEDIAQKNGMENVNIDIKDLDPGPAVKRENLLILFKTPILLKRTLILWFNWFTVSFIIYGLNLNWQTLTGSVFLNFIVSSIVNIPGPALAIWMNMKVGRRFTLIGFVSFSGLMLFLILAFEKDPDNPYKNWPIALLALIGAFGISMSFGTMW